MKRLLAMVLVAMLGIGLFTGSALADWYDFIGYWEVQNVAVDGYTVGGNYLDFALNLVGHNDGILIMCVDEEMGAYYIDGYGGNYYIDDGEDRITLTTDNQGRIHMGLKSSDGSNLDYRMRSATSPRLTARLSSYVGEWKATAACAAEYGDVTMTLYNDGFGVLETLDGLLAVRMSTQAGRFALVDNEGLVMNVSEDSQGRISFTIVFTNTSYQMKLTMERAN